MGPAAAQQYKPAIPLDHPAIDYARGAAADRVGRLGADLQSGRLAIAGGDMRRALADVLQRLGVSTDTQMLVFSKTSVQARHIDPEHPRAIYFADDVAVAYAPGAQMLELSAQDVTRGTVFYTLAPAADGNAVLTRRSDCVSCHQGPNTAGVPGVYVGSVIPGPSGAPLRDESAIITDHRSPFADRWGGWYVTARRGEQRDRANAVASNPADPASLVRESRQNLTSLLGVVDTSGHLAPTSDIVALMTYEHQTQMANLITRVGWQARIAAAESPVGSSAGLDAEIDDLVAYMLFEGEPPLPEPIEGVSSFARTFAERGPRDGEGRSLRDFDLRTRLFRYPLSYMIYSAAFDALPPAVLKRIGGRLRLILNGADRSPRYGYLSRADRRNILEIVLATKPSLGKYLDHSARP
jgi:hypothetical protein